MRQMNFLAIGLLLAIAGCGRSDIANLVAPVQDDKIARAYIDQLKAKQFMQIERDLDPSLRAGFSFGLLNKMASAFPDEEPISLKVVGAWTSIDRVAVVGGQSSERTVVNISYEYQFPSRWVVANVATKKVDGRSTIVGFNVYSMGDSLENTHRFTLIGKSYVQYGFLAMMFIVPAFIICTLVICVRTKIAKRKWLWVLFILFGIPVFSIDWTSGAWSFRAIYFLLLGAGATANAYGPWILSFAFPLGAIIFLARRKHLGGMPANATQDTAQAHGHQEPTI